MQISFNIMEFNANLKPLRKAKVDHPRKIYHCTFEGCKSEFDRPFRLAQHILAHNNIRPYACIEQNCGKAYTSKSHLDRHLRTVHLPQERDVAFNCPRCFKAFANRQNLKRHLNTVHDLEYSCEICDKQFKKKNQLSAHMYQHTGVKAFSCDQCPETFISLYLKKRHMRQHRLYVCNECKMEFNQWSKYQLHLKEDHQRDEFICDVCGRVFKQRCHIVRHVKIHSHLTRAFHCPYENCERYYSRNSNLKQHILVKHLDIMFECMVCHSRLSTKAKLNYHMNLHFNAGEKKPKIPSQNKPDRKKRKDAGSFKTSTALKLAGLSKEPDDMHEILVRYNEVKDKLHQAASMTEEPDGDSNDEPDYDSNDELDDYPNDEPDDMREILARYNEVSEKILPIKSSFTNVPNGDNLCSTSTGAANISGDAQTGLTSSPCDNVVVKTEYIEVEVDVPYDD